MDSKELKNIIKMITETDITEFSMESGEEKISIKRGCAVAALPMSQVYAAPSLQQIPSAAPVSSAALQAASDVQEEEKGETVTSPIVGTFYRAPAPDAAPYIEVGQVIEKGATFCIVEAMKLMNEIEAEFRCRVLKIAKENAQPVEFGDVLFYVERC